MYAHSRLLLRQGFPGTVTEIDTAAGNAVTRSRSAARHQRLAPQALEPSDRDADSTPLLSKSFSIPERLYYPPNQCSGRNQW
jgi:hypothetical protein